LAKKRVRCDPVLFWLFTLITKLVARLGNGSHGSADGEVAAADDPVQPALVAERCDIVVPRPILECGHLIVLGHAPRHRQRVAPTELQKLDLALQFSAPGVVTELHGRVVLGADGGVVGLVGVHFESG
jgi:hypothetical protein